MPKYQFKCKSCDITTSIYTPPLVKEITCPACEGSMPRQLPTLNGPANVKEVVDKNTGITWTENQQDLIQDRKAEYYWTVEVPRMVESGTYSLETMLENSWIYVDDAGKIHVNNMPPDRR